jgi:hypothetical protein
MTRTTELGKNYRQSAKGRRVRLPNGFTRHVNSANFLAEISLFLWIPVTAVLFLAFRPPLAAVLSLVLSWMFLPEKVVYDAPALPPFDKNGFAMGSAFAAALVFCPKRLWRARPDTRLEWLYLVGAIGAWAPR